MGEGKYIINNVNKVISNYFDDRRRNGRMSFALQGGRRSGKTFSACQFLIIRAWNHGDICNVASMTSEQGRLGAYADFGTIIHDHPTLNAGCDILASPREIRMRNSGKIFFNSYNNSETAKGVACDWLYINEANNFTKQQVIDLLANVRKGWIIDFNPNVEFWVSDFFAPEEICKTTWRDNPFLTPLQLQYFEQLKKDAEKPNASAVDIRNYKVYYLGEFSELQGDIFTRDNLRFASQTELRPHLRDFRIFCDPSALRGADYFACVLSARDADTGEVWVLDVFSINEGGREIICNKIREWCASWDVEQAYIETNGIIGIDFFDFAQNSGLPVVGWYSRGNKFERIVANFQDLTKRTIFNTDAPMMSAYLEQVYDFSQKCENDDNIDAVNSSLNLHKFCQS